MHLSIESYVTVCGTFWFMIVAGLNVNFSDVYKPHVFKERCALLREDVIDILILSAPPSLIPCTTEKVGYIGLFFPSLPTPDSTFTLLPTIETTFSQQSSLQGSSSTLETGVSLQNLWRSSMKTISESEIALGHFIETLKHFFTSQSFNGKKYTLVHKFHLFLPNLFCLKEKSSKWRFNFTYSQ